MGAGAGVKLVYGHIPDRYRSLDEVVDAIRAAGLQDSQLILGIDFSKSNKDHGASSNEGRSLHKVPEKKKETNPYESAFSMIANTLEAFDADHMFPVYGFGDALTGNSFVFSFEPNDTPIFGLEACVARYREMCAAVTLSGPTSFAPIIRQAIKMVRQAAAEDVPTFHILLLCADGQVSQSDKMKTEAAIVEASYYPLSIICVGIGDGPWDIMEKYDNRLRGRCFDNFQFVNYDEVFAHYPYIKRKEAFATHALQQIPSQYTACKLLGYLKDDWEMPENFVAPPKPLAPPDRQAFSPGEPGHQVCEGWTAVYHYKLKTYFYMSKETGETLWDKPIFKIYKPPTPRIEDDDIVLDKSASFVDVVLAAAKKAKKEREQAQNKKISMSQIRSMAK